MKSKYFGTDGIRGAFEKEISLELCEEIGYSFGYYLLNKNIKNIIIGEDTRESCKDIRQALSIGLKDFDINVHYLNVVPTPSISYILKNNNNFAGLMITASHNLYKDNGLKFFNQNGLKFLKEEELELEKLLEDSKLLKEEAKKILIKGKENFDNVFIEQYKDYIKKSFEFNNNFEILIDTANGSSYDISEEIFRYFNLNFKVINNRPNGKNINLDCGSTNINSLKEIIKNYDIGFSFDGDADRLIAILKNGKILDGDYIVSIMACYLKDRNKLKNNKVVLTTLSSLAIKKFLVSKGIDVISANPGDKNISEKMNEENCLLGGEPSGHIIIKDFDVIGDGILSSLYLLKIFEDQEFFNKIINDIPEINQVCINIHLDEKDNKEKILVNMDVINFIHHIKYNLKEYENLVVRASGTENMIRVLTESNTLEKAQIIAEKVKLKILEIKEKVKNE